MVKQVELVIDLHDESGGSMSSKIVRSLRDSIDTKKLKSGDVLPPSRRLAKDLGVSRGTIVVAYEQLIAEGYLEARQGSGTVVNPSLSLFQPDEPKKTVKQPTENDVEPRPLRDERDPTQSLGDLTRRPAWKQAWRTAAVSPQLEYELPAQGSAWLQKEIAEHLRVMRATLRDAEDILITGGAREGLGLLLTALGTTRGRNLIIGVEEGGPSTLSAVASQHGAQIVLLPVDKQGLLVRALPNAFLDAVIVTPSYQHPEGAALPLERRHELIAWAKYNGTLIIEDDFDSELRFL
ncbi:MAG TPA: PLP-dependent aminotransferase family protein, partial [Microbacteriaceae bacterium]|nr:PLP-dependent aminotransferase family protein [Microbacteriaceae bacterium]